MTFAEQLREARHATGLSQDKAALRIGMSVSNLRNWEQGRKEPTPYVRRTVLEALARIVPANGRNAL